jgi:type II restriction/modification system DNA methylase subunit YeeA
VKVDQFCGIEIEEFPALIARTALYLEDHIANRDVSAIAGEHYSRFPIAIEPNIRVGNALRIDWNDVLPACEADYVFGNPPFIGRQYRSDQQKADMAFAHNDAAGHGVLDFVTCWFVIAARYLDGTGGRCAFVATNSISQGENVGTLWPGLLAKGLSIDFAHRTFAWTSESITVFLRKSDLKLD